MPRVRILFLTPDLPFPADQGAKLRNLALIRAAAQHHQVDLLSFMRSNGDRSRLTTHDSRLADSRLGDTRLGRVQLVPAPGPRAGLRRAWTLLFDPMPDIAYRLESGDYRSTLWELLQEQRYDVIQIEGLEMMPYLAAARGGAERAGIIYDAHNAEMSLQRTIFQAEFHDPRRWHAGLYSLTQWSKLGTYERVMMNATDMVLAVSAGDAAKLQGRHVTPELIPNGVDTASIPYREPSAAPRSSVLFVGPLDYRPNADAVRWLLATLWPTVSPRIPGVELRLVGRGTERLRQEGVTAVGYVEDVAAEFQRADALVVPMRMGGGVRFKVLEAMAAGVPVVSTPLGIAGIAAEHERHALIARDALGLADALVRVLEDCPLARELAQRARLLVEGRYDWKRITPQYLRLLTAARKRGR